MTTERLKRIGLGSAGVVLPVAPLPLHAMVVSAGYSNETKSTYDWHGLKRGKAEFALFQYTLRGEGELTYEGTTRHVKPGTAMLLYFPHDNRYRLPASSRSWEFVYICLNGSAVMAAWKDMVKRYGALLTMDAECRAVGCAVDILEQARDGAFTSAFDASQAAYRLTMMLCDAAAGEQESGHEAVWLTRVKRYIASNTGLDLSVADLAYQSGYSRYHFTRVFREHTGVSPAAYIMQVRIRRAVDLLRNTSLTVHEVGIRTGMPDANHFCRVFRNAIGMSPGAYRKSGM
ncbi:MAG: AraC family transcriptional regulator [Spirochaetes bacterium]|nr:AraC family transcriptional regulator [Spirochaetota bacterium]